MSRQDRMARRILEGRAFSETALIFRQEAGARNDYGEWVAGEEETESVRVATQPLTSKDAADLRDVVPEGSRLRDARRFWLRPDIAPIRVGTGQTEGDIIEYDSTRYRVLRVERWRGYIAAIGVREEASP